ncbi:MAG: hypothetical protein MUP44_08750 [Anaerolineales bacterium]|nr:hypothetical protein [Anaerolineales bacterium]
MTTFIVDARAIRNTDANTVELTLDFQGRKVEMTAPMGATLEEVALLILAQDFPPTPPQAFHRRVVIEAHRENGTIVLPGAPWILDDVTLEQLPDERAADDFSALPGWATWTADEAAQWIAANVTDLAGAKTALTAMARAIILLRDWRR